MPHLLSFLDEKVLKTVNLAVINSLVRRLQFLLHGVSLDVGLEATNGTEWVCLFCD